MLMMEIIRKIMSNKKRPVAGALISIFISLE